MPLPPLSVLTFAELSFPPFSSAAGTFFFPFMCCRFRRGRNNTPLNSLSLTITRTTSFFASTSALLSPPLAPRDDLIDNYLCRIWSEWRHDIRVRRQTAFSPFSSFFNETFFFRSFRPGATASTSFLFVDPIVQARLLAQHSLSTTCRTSCEALPPSFFPSTSLEDVLSSSFSLPAFAMDRFLMSGLED